MSGPRKPTSLGIPAPVAPAPTTPLRKPPTLGEIETPATIDRGSVNDTAAHTMIDDEEAHKQKFVPVVSEPRWDENSTVAQKSAKAAARANSSPIVDETLAPTPTRNEDSGRVLADFDDSRVGGPTNVDEDAAAVMPTAINPSVNGEKSTHPADGRLVVIGGNDRGREFVLSAREITLGRGVDNDIILTDIAVSRRHLVFIREGHRFGVRDRSSGNGTLVNGVRIVGDFFLHDGDQLELGNTLIRFEQADVFAQAGAPPAQPPVASVVVNSGLFPIPPPLVGMTPVPLPGVSPSLGPGASSSRTPAMTAAFGSGASSNVLPLPPVPTPPPPSTLIPEASSSDFVPIATEALGPMHPSAVAMDLLKAQRKLLMYIGGAVLGFALLVWIAARFSNRSDTQHQVVSTEASTSPALNALLTDVNKAEPPPAPAPAPAAEPAAAVAPTPEPVAPPPAPATAPAPAPKPAKAKPRRANVAAVAERSAIAAYRERDFDRASDILRAAAARENGASASRLESLARDYAQLGVSWAKGDAAAAGNPTLAMGAYKQAYQLDARSGRGLHASYLRNQLGKVLPRAASVYLSAGKFELARSACDDAQAFGTGTDPTVARVRNLLEGKARDLYNQGAALSRSKPDEARALWRRVLKMVPAQSPWYSKAYAALNKSSKSQDEDE
jgi:pSer/pThr/pTyr-binding forkhead associated (FHA) protein/tetratricopeptide (TPR) repeat protein